MATLGQYAVHLTDEAGVLRSFLPGQEVPDWAAAQLGPHCFPPGQGGAGPTPAAVPEPVGGDTAAGPPPRSGKGSSESAWRRYADEHGVDVTSLEGRDDIIAACQEAGIAVE
ncbi:MAG: hypothetical protein KDB47_06920 [Mycobacterium sp.]|nr:hypothetical protein [Mycobacterium sp.]